MWGGGANSNNSRDSIEADDQFQNIISLYDSSHDRSVDLAPKYCTRSQRLSSPTAVCRLQSIGFPHTHIGPPIELYLFWWRNAVMTVPREFNVTICEHSAGIFFLQWLKDVQGNFVWTFRVQVPVLAYPDLHCDTKHIHSSTLFMQRGFAQRAGETMRHDNPLCGSCFCIFCLYFILYFVSFSHSPLFLVFLSLFLVDVNVIKVGLSDSIIIQWLLNLLWMNSVTFSSLHIRTENYETRIWGGFTFSTFVCRL